MTIMREWRGRTNPDKVQAALDYYRTNVKPKLTATPGFKDAALSKRDLGGLIEIVLVTRWRDMDAVRAFIGSAPERAFLPAETQEMFDDSETFVRLYDIIDEA